MPWWYFGLEGDKPDVEELRAVVDGDTATGTYLLWVGITDNEVYQRENLTYTRTPEGWVIQSIDLRFGRMLNS